MIQFVDSAGLSLKYFAAFSFSTDPSLLSSHPSNELSYIWRVLRTGACWGESGGWRWWWRLWLWWWWCWWEGNSLAWESALEKICVRWTGSHICLLVFRCVDSGHMLATSRFETWHPSMESAFHHVACIVLPAPYTPQNLQGTRAV